MNRSARSKIHVAKSNTEPVPAKPGVPPTRQRGRPKGSLNKKTVAERALFVSESPAKQTTSAQPNVPPTFDVAKAKKTFDKMVSDAILAQHEIAEPTFDGGGTSETGHVVSKESLERRVARRLNVLDRYLTDERLLSLLAMSGLKEVGIYEGIMMDKALVLKGQPTVIIGNDDRSHMDQILPRLLQEIRRRKLITSVSERKIEFTSPGGDSESS